MTEEQEDPRERADRLERLLAKVGVALEEEERRGDALRVQIDAARLELGRLHSIIEHYENTVCYDEGNALTRESALPSGAKALEVSTTKLGDLFALNRDLLEVVHAGHARTKGFRCACELCFLARKKGFAK